MAVTLPEIETKALEFLNKYGPHMLRPDTEYAFAAFCVFRDLERKGLAVGTKTQYGFLFDITKEGREVRQHG